MSLEASSVLNSAGLPSMALEALRVAQRILEVQAGQAAEGSKAVSWSQDKSILSNQSNRLLVNCLSASFSPRGSRHGVEAVEVKVLGRLGNLLASGLPCDPQAVTDALRRHAKATAISDRQPLLPPLKLRQQIGSRRFSNLGTPPLSPTDRSSAQPGFGSPTSPIGSPPGSGGGLHHIPRLGGPSVSPRASMELRSPRRSGGSFAGSSPVPPTAGGRATGGGAGIPSRSSSGISVASASAASGAAHHSLSLFDDPLEVRYQDGL